MKEIKTVGFTDFSPGLDIYNNIFVKTLKEITDIEIIDLKKNKTAQPDIVIGSVFGYDILNYDGIRIMFSGENQIPDFNLYDYAMGSHYISFGDRYIRMPYYSQYPDLMARDIDLSKRDRKFCAMVISASECEKDVRTQFFYELSKYKQVDSAGEYLNNVGYKLPIGTDEKLKFLSNYKFSFAFENSSTEGYCTEKIIDSYGAGTIPIYWGDPKVEEYFYADSFIKVRGIDDFDNAIKKIIELDNNDELYYQMLNRKKIKDEYTASAFCERLRVWLKAIVEQNKEEAYRRNLSPRGVRYQKHFKIIDAIMTR